MADRVYVGITDRGWYDFLSLQGASEVNFWKPGGGTFKALGEGDLFLFKLKRAQGDKVAGGGFFASATTMPLDWAWKAFGTENGVSSYGELRASIARYRARSHPSGENPEIGCIVLTDVFWFGEDLWFEAPDNWRSIVSGKTFSPGDEGYAYLIDRVEERLASPSVPISLEWERNRWGVSTTRHRLGQGAFRVMVADAYGRRCAVSGERTLPVLQAAHIRPYAQEGPHDVQNGLLLRSDIHALFDEGYVTVTPDFRIEVSRRLNEDYGNGRMYYAYQGKRLAVLPNEQRQMPSREFLEWHNDCVFMR